MKLFRLTFPFLAASAVLAQSNPAQTSSLRLVSGTVNGQSVSPSNPSITVSPGAALSGSFTVQVDSTYASSSAMAMGATPTWGTHSTSFIDLGSFSTPVSGLNRTVPVNWTAPSTAGTYYIVVAFGGEFSAAALMSCTNWSYGNPVWNDGNDVADWSAATIATAMANGTVQVAYLYPTGMAQQYVPSTAIEVVVAAADPGSTSSLSLVSGTVNGQSVSSASPAITVAEGAALSGSFTVQIVSTYASNAVMSMGATPTWGTHSTSFIDVGGFSTPTNGLNRTVTVNWTAPTTPGTYYIVAAFAGEYSAAAVMSCTNWSYGNPVWNDGNDVADWSSATIEGAMSSGRAYVPYLLSAGMQQLYVPATAIRVVVGGTDPAATSSLKLVSGTVNGQSVSPSNPGVNVTAGTALSGSFVVQVNSTYPSSAVMSMGATPTWGTPSTSFVDLGGFSTPASGLNRTVTVNWTAPTTPGMYYIVAAFGGEYSAAALMSCTNWSYGNPNWNSGDAIADWSASSIESAISNGRVQVPYLFAAGTEQQFVDATAIRIVVSPANPPPTSSLKLVSGTVNGQSVSTATPGITVAPGAALSGSFVVQINSTYPSSAVVSMGATPTWGPHSTNFIDLGGISTPVSGLNRTVTVSWTAPKTQGTYYIVAAFGGEYSAAAVMSCTNWSYGNPVWNDGNDVADWSSTTIESAISTGNVQVEYLFSAGMQLQYVPATAIRIVVAIAPPTILLKVSGDNQTASTGTAFAQPLVVQANDGTGTAVPNVPVHFLASGPVTLSASSATTDGSGRAQVTVTAGSSAGAATVTAATDSLSAAFNLTVTAVTACNYFVNPLSESVAAAGGSVLLLVSTAPACAWTVVSNSSWISVSGSASITGSGAAEFTVSANTSTASRTGSLTIAGQTLTVTQAAGSQGPSITSITNAASWTSSALGVARGSYIAILGTQLGPSQSATSSGYPLPTVLGTGNVSVNISQGSTQSQAYLEYVSATQINAILPSALTAGSASVTVSYNGVTGPAYTIDIVDSSFGVFFTQQGGNAIAVVQNVQSATNYPLNMTAAPATPGEIIVIWGTGLGPIASADNATPPVGDVTTAVTITVGGKSASRQYSGRAPNFAGVDNVYAQLPSDVPLGCYVPLIVTVNGTVSNTTTISISADGTPCQ
jgi:uncharacterized protein (TIGR03437 family)